MPYHLLRKNFLQALPADVQLRHSIHDHKALGCLTLAQYHQDYMKLPKGAFQGLESYREYWADSSIYTSTAAVLGNRRESQTR
jgi:hypothetical protein